jgi:hypothetical protein
LAAEVEGALPYIDELAHRMQTLDLDLPHSDPPMEPATTGRRTCIGPHGDYYLAQRMIFLAIHYWREWAEEWLKIFAAPTGQRKAMGEALSLYAHCTIMQHQAGALLAGVALNWQWETLDGFSKVLKVTELLTRQDHGEGTPSVYFAFMLTWAKLASSSQHYQNSLRRYADSWAKNEPWEVLVFPNSERSRPSAARSLEARVADRTMTPRIPLGEGFQEVKRRMVAAIHRSERGVEPRRSRVHSGSGKR